MSHPYLDIINNSEHIIREFNEDLDQAELVWHRDREDRVVRILEPGDGWKFQFEDELPFTIEPNMSISISKGEWHRVIKGLGTLKIQIFKH